MRIGLLKRLLQGLAAVERAVSAERGEFSLFALIEKEDWEEDAPTPTGSSWYLYVAAPWIWENRRAVLKYLHERVRPYEEGWNPFMRSLSIHIVPVNSPHLEEVWEYCSTADGMVEVYNVEILDVTALRGYIFASRRPAKMPQPPAAEGRISMSRTAHTPPPEPQDAAGYNRRGNQYSRNGAYEPAIADYTRALELDAAFAEAWFNRGVSYYELGMYDQSIADLTQAIALNPQEDNYYGRRALAYLFDDQPDLAQADQDKCDQLRNGG